MRASQVVLILCAVHFACRIAFYCGTDEEGSSTRGPRKSTALLAGVLPGFLFV
jgi:hypothetical protein